MTWFLTALLLVATPSLGGRDIPLDGTYRGPVCLDPLPAPPEKMVKVSGRAWKARVPRGELPEWLVPLRYGRAWQVRPGGRYYGSDGFVYSFRQVEQALARYGMSQKEFMTYRGAIEDEAMARSDIDRARPTLSLGGGGYVTVSGGWRCKDAEDRVACLVTGVNATALSRARDRLRSAEEARELAFIQAVCKFNGGHTFEREERARIEALQSRAGAIRRTLVDPPPTSHWLVSSLFYAALGQEIPADDATWARDVVALSAALAADPDIEALLARTSEATADGGDISLHALLASLSGRGEHE